MRATPRSALHAHTSDSEIQRGDPAAGIQRRRRLEEGSSDDNDDDD
jgi:hypothetical protein